MVKSGALTQFSPEGPCPASPRELHECVLRFVCNSPTFGPFPASAVGLNADLRRAYQRLGHERAALGVFRAGSTADAIRAIHADLQAAGCSSALVLEDGAAGDDLLILDADRQKIHRVLLGSLAANGDAGGQHAAAARPRCSAGAPTDSAHEVGRNGTSKNGLNSAPAGRDHSGGVPLGANGNTARRGLDADDELMRLLAEPTVRKKDWGPQAGAQGEGEPGQSGGAAAAPCGVVAPCGSPPEAADPVRARSRRRRRRRHRSSSSAAGPDEDGRPDRKRRRRRERSRSAAASPADPSAPVPSPSGPPDASAPGVPPPGSTFVFTPDAAGGAAESGDIPLPEPAPRRSVSSVPLFEWVSASSLSDLKAVRGKGGDGKGRGRRSRSRGDGPDEPGIARGERPEKLAGDAWEESREKTGLRLLGESCTYPWMFPLMDEGRRSFVGYLARVLSAEDCQGYYERIKSCTEWQQPEGPLGPLPRKTCWMVSRGCTCTYRYGGIEVSPQEFPPWMQELLTVLMPLCGLQEPTQWPNSCNLNLYDDGGMSVGWHSDDERLFQGRFSDCRIISLSLGARRRFEVRLNWPEEGEQQSWQVVLGDGDLLTMEGMMQKHFQHRVPREDNVTSPRINLTWRWVARHAPRCPVERHRRP